MPPRTSPGAAPLSLNAANPAKCSAGPCNGPLQNPYNNDIVGQPTVYLVFQGPLWGQGWQSSTKNAMTAFVQGLPNSNFQTILNQYYDSTRVIAWNSVTLGGVWVDSVAPTVINPTNAANEADRAWNTNHWGLGDQYLYIIIPQTGAQYTDGACGWHDWVTSNTPLYPTNTFNVSMIEWAPDKGAGCLSYGNNGGTDSAMTNIESHEYAEAVTDPTLNAWCTGSPNCAGTSTGEIADLCNGYTGSYAVNNQWVQQLWSNLPVGGSSGCTTFISRTFGFNYINASFTTGMTLANGHGYGVFLQVQNTGNVPWQVGQAWGVHLGTYNPTNRCSSFSDGSWAGCNRIWISSNASVGGSFPIRPGDVAQFNWNFNPAAGLGAGSYFEEFDLVAEQVGYFTCGGSCLNWTLSVGSYAGCYVSQSDPKPTGGIFIPGDTYTATVTYNNCGSNEWWPWEEARLGTSHPQNRTSAFSDSTWVNSIRPDIVRSYTGPGGNYTFSYHLFIPCKQAAGTYVEYFQPLAENTTWFTDSGYHVTINVGKVPDVTKCVL